jgi:hypothetical protein
MIARGDRQRESGGKHQQAVDEQLPAAREPREEMRIGVPREQHDLEEQDASGPHAGAAAEPRQDELADDRLYLKEQERAQQREQAKLQGDDGARG